MKIVLAEPLGVSKERIAELAKPLVARGHEFVAYDAKASNAAELTERLEGAEAAIIANSPFYEETAAVCGLKYLSVAFTGVDHVAVETLRGKGCRISNCAGYATEATAELAIALTLDVLRRVTALDHATRAGRGREGFAGGELRGRKFGVVGSGAIALRACSIAKAFGAELYAYSRSERAEAVAMGVKYLPLDELMSTCDVISLHVPATSETKGMISAEKLALMKPTAILINTARGTIVDNKALADALKAGAIAGAGIDVYETEPPIENHPLYACENAVLTPHIGFASEEAMVMRAGMAFDNVEKWLDGTIQNEVK